MRSIDLIAGVLVSVAAAALVVGADSAISWARLVFTLPLVLVLPGYAMAEALFVADGFGFPSRLAMSIGLSLSISVVTGLALNITSWGLSSGPFALVLCLIVVCLSFVALVRRQEEPTGQSRKAKVRSNFLHVLLLILAGAIVAGAALVAVAGSAYEPDQGFTQMWLSPAGHEASNGQDKVQLSIRSREVSTVSFSIDAIVAGQTRFSWRNVELAPGETWEVLLLLPPAVNNRQELEAVLIRDDSPGQVYRRVALWLDR